MEEDDGIRCPTSNGRFILSIRPILYPQGFANCDMVMICKSCKTETRDLLKYSDKQEKDEK